MHNILVCPAHEYAREGDDIELFITLVPKVLCDNFGDFYWILIGLFIKFRIHTFQPPILLYRMGTLCIVIGNVHQFIGHCPIPLDPCEYTLHTLIFSHKAIKTLL